MDLVMRVCCVFLVSLLVLTSALAHASSQTYCGTNPWQPFIQEAAARFNVPSQWIDTVIRVESAGCASIDGKPTVSPAGAMGLMQLMPTTWQTFKERLKLGEDPHYPRDNILAGTAYLAELHQRYGVPGAFVAYHAGPARYDEHLTGSRTLPTATLDYLARIHATYEKITGKTLSVSTANDATTMPLFVPLSARERRENSLGERSLFVTLERKDTPFERAAQKSDYVQQK